MKRRICILLALVCFFGAGAASLAQTSAKPSQHNSKGNPVATSKVQASSSDGEKRFQTNCGRCHNPPEDISPREARAVVRQMRVRAMLSAEDEKLILEFLAP